MLLFWHNLNDFMCVIAYFPVFEKSWYRQAMAAMEYLDFWLNNEYAVHRFAIMFTTCNREMTISFYWWCYILRYLNGLINI